jgi:hypothetical protein
LHHKIYRTTGASDAISGMAVNDLTGQYLSTVLAKITPECSGKPVSGVQHFTSFYCAAEKKLVGNDNGSLGERNMWFSLA